MKGCFSKHVIEVLEAESVEYVFGMPGSHVLYLFDALSKAKKIKFIPVLHENNGVYMANMYAYLTGKPGVTLFTAGPGATNSVTAVIQAYVSSIPLIHITGDVHLHAVNESFHGVDSPNFLSNLFENITKKSIRVEKPEEIFDILSEAFFIAQSGRPGPVHIDIPLDIANSEILVSPYVKKPPKKNFPSRELLELINNNLKQAKFPVICACRGVLSSFAENELREFAELIGSPVLSTTYACGAFNLTHQLSIGTFNEFSGNKFAFDIIRKSDLLLVFGMRPNTLMTQILHSLKPQNSIFIAFDDQREINNSFGFEKVFSCDCKEVLSELLKCTDRKKADDGMLAEITSMRKHFDTGLDKLLSSYENTIPVHFGMVLKKLKDNLHDDAMIISGVGNHHVWARTIFSAKNRESFVAEGSWGSMGSEIGAGIAAKMLYPNRQIVVVTGDASFLMNCSDFLTAVYLKLPLLVIVLNDSRLGIISAMQQLKFKKSFGDKIGKANFSKFSCSFGGVGLTITNPSKVSEIVKKGVEMIAQGNTPVLFDVICGYKFPWPNIEKLIELGKNEHYEYS